jgi:hypothetical protein
MKGDPGIPALRLEVLNRVIELHVKAPTAFFSGMFGSFNNDSDAIKWETVYGSGGITPFVAPGAPAPTVGVDGTGEGSAKAAYWKEKTYFDEEFLNNLKEPGTMQTYMTAERTLARQILKLKNRCLRRREWMVSKMFTDGRFTYLDQKGMAFTVDYGVPATCSSAPVKSSALCWASRWPSTTSSMNSRRSSCRTPPRAAAPRSTSTT